MHHSSDVFQNNDLRTVSVETPAFQTENIETLLSSCSHEQLGTPLTNGFSLHSTTTDELITSVANRFPVLAIKEADQDSKLKIDRSTAGNVGCLGGEDFPQAPANMNTASLSIAYLYPPPLNYPVQTPSFHRSPISILATPEKGRGVYATEDIPVGTLIEISPVILLSSEEYYGGGREGEGKGVEGSVLRGYVFTWKGKEGGMALALGLGSLFNHSTTPNVSFELDTASYTIHYKIFRSVASGEELCIFYGHNARFDGDLSEGSNSTISESDDDCVWGGLDGIGSMRSKTQKGKNKADEDIVLFQDLEWNKVTTEIPVEDIPLTIIKCWAIDVPAKYTGDVFKFVRRHADPNVLSHLQRVRSPKGQPRHAETIISVVLFPLEQSPSDLESLLDKFALEKESLGFFASAPFVVDAPASIARTEFQARTWSEVWPVSMAPLREGPLAVVKPKGWTRAKKAWIKKEGEKIWRAALDAQKRGEHPIACHVTDSFHPEVHSASSLPKTLVRAHDTRMSTKNCLSHAASNAIDAVAILDRQGARAPPLLPHLPPPYLLTGLTVFMSHEPCLLCCMSLLHSRISHLFFIKKSPGSGGLGSLYSVHEDGGLNHRFEVWEWKGSEDEKYRAIGVGCEVSLDP